MPVTPLQGSMKISVKLPVMVSFDNVGAIFMASNVTTASCMKHIDIKYKHVNEYVEDKVVQKFCAEPAENKSIALTKNLSAELHQSIQRK